MKRFLILILSAIMINVSMGRCFIWKDSAKLDNIHSHGSSKTEEGSSTCKLCASHCFTTFPSTVSTTINIFNSNSYDQRVQFLKQDYYPTLWQPPKVT